MELQVDELVGFVEDVISKNPHGNISVGVRKADNS